jgi:hypothetical protein
MQCVANPHDEKLRLCWRLSRFGLVEVRESEKQRRVLAWIDRMRPLFPQSPYLERWAMIVSGRDEACAEELGATTDFFALPLDRRGFWRGLIQSQPFSCLLPRGTSRERRAVLSRLP